MSSPAAARCQPRAEALFDLSRPTSSEIHLIESGAGFHVLAVDGSRFYDVDQENFRRLDAAIAEGCVDAALADMGLVQQTRAIDDTPPTNPPIRALSLAVAQKCNLGCTYCYAQEGSFGAKPRNMGSETA